MGQDEIPLGWKWAVVVGLLLLVAAAGAGIWYGMGLVVDSDVRGVPLP